MGDGDIADSFHHGTHLAGTMQSVAAPAGRKRVDAVEEAVHGAARSVRGTEDDNVDCAEVAPHAGIAGATGNNRIGGSGVAQRVQIMTCRAFDGGGHGDMLAVVRCMDYSLRMGANVTLNSYGSRMPALPMLQHAISQMQVRELRCIWNTACLGHAPEQGRERRVAAGEWTGHCRRLWQPRRRP